MDAAQDTIVAMMQREETSYRRQDYMQPCRMKTCTCDAVSLQQKAALDLLEECALMVTDPMSSSSSSLSSVQIISRSTVNKVPSVTCVQDFEETFRMESTTTTCPTCDKHHHHSAWKYPPYPSTDSLQFWREQMFDWSCMVADSFGVMDRTAVIANSFQLLDRYVDKELSSNSIPITREDFQLFSMTCLFISVKMLDGGHKLTVEALVQMSRNFYKPQDIIATENEILHTLQWRVTPPTTIAYCRLLWEFLPIQQKWEEWEALCSTLTEVSVASASFLECRNSVVALAVLVLSARYRGCDENTIQLFFHRVQPILAVKESEYLEVYHQLKSLY